MKLHDTRQWQGSLNAEDVGWHCANINCNDELVLSSATPVRISLNKRNVFFTCGQSIIIVGFLAHNDHKEEKILPSWKENKTFVCNSTAKFLLYSFHFMRYAIQSMLSHIQFYDCGIEIFHVK